MDINFTKDKSKSDFLNSLVRGRTDTIEKLCTQNKDMLWWNPTDLEKNLKRNISSFHGFNET